MGSGHLSQQAIEESWPLAKGPYCEQLRGWIKKDSHVLRSPKGHRPQRIYAENRKEEMNGA